MASGYDLVYKKLFSNKVYLKQLLSSFVAEPWVDEIDFSQSETVDKSFVTEDYRRQEADLIWKLRHRGKTFYLYLLIEFQSTVDRFMSLRMLSYICELYRAMIEERFGDGPYNSQKLLPPIFPLLLYNGQEHWTAPEQLSDLIEPLISTKFMPSFSYYKIAENEIAPEHLLEIGNLVSSLFFCETADTRTIKACMDRIYQILKKAKGPELALFGSWVRHTFLGEDAESSAILVAEGVMIMLEEAVARRDKISFEEGMEKGRQEGRQEGLELGLEKGAQQGREDSRRETARRLKAMGMESALITAATDLSAEEIERL
jgi:hypothetical protein